MDPGARVCPHCGESPGDGVFCAHCGRNLSGVQQLPTRAAWELSSRAAADARETGTRSGRDPVPAFLAAMHAAGDPGATKTAMSKPASFGRTRHVHGWIVRPTRRDPEDELSGYEPGVFLTTDGRLHRLDSAARGWGQRDFPRFYESVGDELGGPPADDRLAGELDELLRAHGVTPRRG